MVSNAERVVRVLVVDDHTVVRKGLRAMLGGDPGLEVVGEASGGEEAVSKAAELEPDVVLMDIQMPDISGIESTRRIKEAKPATCVIMITVYESEIYVVEALRAGAAGYLLKDSSPELLCHAVKAVVDGASMVGSALLRRAVGGAARDPQLRRDGPAGPGLMQRMPLFTERLTAREMDVLRLVAQGLANKEIARKLNVAEFTAKKHVQNIIAKLNVSDRTQAAIVAVKVGVVD